MPLLGFRPTKARLVMENAKDSVLVMKVTLDTEESVELATGESLADLSGVLRIKERKGNGAAANGNGAIGSVVYVSEQARNGEPATGKFQVNVGMGTEKFSTLLRVANAGRLPTKFIVDAGGPASKPEGKALSFRMRSGARVKLWDNHAFRILPVTNFVMILPIDVPTMAPGSEPSPRIDAVSPPVALATNAQVAELMDDMLVFQSDTRNTMFGLVLVLAIVALAALALGIGVLFR
jgi:ABC-type Na+ efflux pump permease subunit